MQVTIYIPEDLLGQIDEKAAAEGCNRSQFLVRSALANEGTLTPKLRRQLGKKIAQYIKDELEF
jgi:metal-responsive CopG/Arc/MetJ family transcriptional regulator